MAAADLVPENLLRSALFAHAVLAQGAVAYERS